MKKISTTPDITIRQAMKKLNQSGEKSLVIINKNKVLLGTLSDGDLRKAILSGAKMKDSIDSCYQSNPTVLKENHYNLNEAKKIFTQNKFDLIPVVDERGVLIKILFWENLFNDSKLANKVFLDASVVIMAGGKGTRLEPFTKILPKPLIPIHDKPIIEHIADRFKAIGCSDFLLTINYKSKILKAYFEEVKSNYNIKFYEEKKPLGTAGSLHYLDGRFKEPFFVTNCDIIIDADYSSIYQFHCENEFDITLVASTKEYIIPYGTCELDKSGHLLRLNEKPNFELLINTGFYVFNPNILKLIPKGEFFHVTQLIEKAKEQGKRVGIYPVDEDSWTDVGQWTEYKKALDTL